MFSALPTSLLFFGWLMSQKETDCLEEELPEPVMPIVAQPEEQLERITVKRGNAIEVLTLDEILYFSSRWRLCDHSKYERSFFERADDEVF